MQTNLTIDALQRQFVHHQSATISKTDTTVVIPVKNEELAISKVIDELTQEGYPNILVVDGYSADNTLKLIEAKQGVTILQQHGNGKTDAIKTAIENVSTPYMIILDGDYTYPAKDIQKLLAHGTKYAQVIGVRDRKNISRIHKFGNRIITNAFNLLMNTHFSDICSGMYLLRTDIACSLELGSKNFATEVEIAAQTVCEYDVTEVPIGYRRRIGKPKLSWRNGFQILLAVVGLARKYNPLLLFSAFSVLSIIPALGLLGWVAFQYFFFAVWHSGWALIGVMLLLFASQALAITTTVLLHSNNYNGSALKRTEKRILQHVEKRA